MQNKKSRLSDSNREPLAYEAIALPLKLRRQEKSKLVYLQYSC